MKSFVRLVFALIIVFSALVAFALEPVTTIDSRWLEPARARIASSPLDPSAVGAPAEAARDFLAVRGGTWEFRIDTRTGLATMVQGSGVPLIPGRGNALSADALSGLPLPDGDVTTATLEPLARAFIERHAALVAPRNGQLRLDAATSGGRDRSRLHTLNFDWWVDGIQVEGARVFVRLNSGNVTQFGSAYLGRVDGPTAPVLTAGDARRTVLAYAGDDELARIVDEPRLLLQPESDGNALTYRLVWRLTYRLPGRHETWEGRVDATDGRVVGFRDINQYARVSGAVYPRTVTDTETVAPMPLATVQLDTGNVTADVSGAFAYPGGPVQSGLDSDLFRTNCTNCQSPAQATIDQSVGGGVIDFGFGGVDAAGNGLSTPAERNAFFHMNQVRRIGLKWLPTLGWFDQQITVNVNIQNTCNASYGGNTTNFYRSGGGCNNTGEVSDVMHHEWGHGIDGNTQGGDGATGEATADVVAMSMSHDARIGPYFRTDGSPVRDLDKSRTAKGLLTRSNIPGKCGAGPGPLGFAVHCEGEIYGQSHWDLSQSLVAKHGHHTGWRTLERVFFTSLPDAGGYLPEDAMPVYDAYINADDDDGNLANGTPNGDEIFQAFNTHEIAGTPRTSSAQCARPQQPAVNVASTCSSFDLSWNAVAGIDHYEVLRAELREDTAYMPVATVAAGTEAYTDTTVMPGVDYWYVVMAVDGAGCESTVEGPVFARLPAQPIVAATAAVSDDIPRGNRSGFPDPGEEVDLTVTLGNSGQADALGISGTLSSSTPGVTVLQGFDTWPDLAVGATADNDTFLRFETDDTQVACGDSIRFTLDVAESSSCTADDSFVEVRMGDVEVLYADDFETDDGWAWDSASSTASLGHWVYGDPDGTSYQPEDDSTAAPGRFCWFTATNGGGAGTDDVDDGETVLLSPAIDLSGMSEALLRYDRWFANRDVGEDPDDFFIAEVSNDDGANWVNLETLGSNDSAPNWTTREFKLQDILALTGQMRLRFRASDGTLDGNIIEAAVDEVRITRSVCDDTPACYVEPTFAGLESAGPGGSCAEASLAWQPASSNCQNATIVYNVYRSTDAGFTPGPGSLIATGLTGTTFEDSLLEPGVTYHYIVRADDSRSGEDSNMVLGTVTAPTSPDVKPPVFGGLDLAQSGQSCGEAALTWAAAQETCSAPIVYNVYRGTDPGFTPGPANRVASTFSLGYTDAALMPGQSYTYVVRAGDEAGNEDANDVRLTVTATILDKLLSEIEFEADDAGWSVVAPDDATTGNWQWGDPEGTSYQPEDDFTSGAGVNAWVTGLAASGGGGGNDVDDGTTTLLSALYDLSAAVDPIVRYARWFTNDLGGSPGEDPFDVEVSNDDGVNWTLLEQVGAGTPLAWVEVELPLGGVITPTDQMRFRFTARDLGAGGSLVEAAIDGFDFLDGDQGCLDCPAPVNVVGTIVVNRVGDDVELDWSADPAAGTRFAIYKLTGPGFAEQTRIGTTDGKTFVHEGAALSAESFYYRVTAIDACGNESSLQ